MSCPMFLSFLLKFFVSLHDCSLHQERICCADEQSAKVDFLKFLEIDVCTRLMLYIKSSQAFLLTLY